MSWPVVVESPRALAAPPSPALASLAPLRSTVAIEPARWRPHLELGMAIGAGWSGREVARAIGGFAAVERADDFRHVARSLEGFVACPAVVRGLAIPAGPE